MQKTIDGIYTQTLRTGSILKKAELEHLGWDTVILDPSIISEPQTYSIVWDQPTGFCFMFAAPTKVFTALSTKSLGEPEVIEGVKSFVSYAIGHMAGNKIPSDAELVRNLSSMMAYYAGTTKVWQTANGMADGGSFVVINYRKPNNFRSSILRPFVIPADRENKNRAVSYAELERAVSTVIQSDRQNHPEWLMGALS